MKVIVAYDITSPRRITRAAKVILDYGQRVLKSVYEVHVSPKRLRELKNRLAHVIDPETDGVKFYRLCKSCDASCTCFGQGQKAVMDETVIII